MQADVGRRPKVFFAEKENPERKLPEQWILFFVFSTLLLGSLFEPGNYANDRFSALAKKGENAVSGVECGDWRQGGKGREEKKV